MKELTPKEECRASGENLSNEVLLGKEYSNYEDPFMGYHQQGERMAFMKTRNTCHLSRKKGALKASGFSSKTNGPSGPLHGSEDPF